MVGYVPLFSGTLNNKKSRLGKARSRLAISGFLFAAIKPTLYVRYMIELSPITSRDAEACYQEIIGRLLRAAYLQPFNQARIDSCKWKFPTFSEWWKTLSDDAQMRVKGVLASEVL
jgi:hypothetical protein